MTFPRHPWNTSFSWPRHTGPFRSVTDEQARSYDEQGFFVLEDALGQDTLRMLDAEIAPFDERALEFLRGQPEGRFNIAGVDTVSIALHLVKHSPALRAFCASPMFADLCHDLVGPDSRSAAIPTTAPAGPSARTTPTGSSSCCEEASRWRDRR
jgi:phytanoyl-CoA hydroxylase